MTCVSQCDSQRIDGPTTERLIYYNSLIFEGKGSLLKILSNISACCLHQEPNGIGVQWCTRYMIDCFFLFRMRLLPTAPDSV